MNAKVIPLKTYQEAPRPPVKWPGGKRQLLAELATHVPQKFGYYYEPFMGGGALFFYLASKATMPMAARLGDVNRDLMEMYAALRDDCEKVVRSLRHLEELYRKTGTDFYYKTRNMERPFPSRADRAARFVFLNKTCFNGLYRVNSDGKFNVPEGKHAKAHVICDKAVLRAASRSLKVTSLATGDFDRTTAGIARGDFVYFDPPYIGGFTSYTAEGFGMKDHQRLRDLATGLKRRGVHVLLSQADNAETRALYRKDFEWQMVGARRVINSNASGRGPVGELIIW